MSTTPFTLSGSFDYPPDDGQPIAARDYSVSNSFESKKEGDYVLSGAGTQVVDFGTVAKAKAFLIEVDPDTSPSAAPINVTINGGTDQWEISPGGFIAYASPVPSVGITSMSIAHTVSAKVRVRLLG